MLEDLKSNKRVTGTQLVVTLEQVAANIRGASFTKEQLDDQEGYLFKMGISFDTPPIQCILRSEEDLGVKGIRLNQSYLPALLRIVPEYARDSISPKPLIKRTVDDVEEELSERLFYLLQAEW